MHYITEAEHVDGYKIKVRFEDGHVKLVDLGAHLDGRIFEPLRDPVYFSQFAVNHEIDTITWPNNADFSPDFLYEIGEEIHEKLAECDSSTSVRYPVAGIAKIRKNP
jgi:hypothetical protein